jgi:hypothetical protein
MGYSDAASPVSAAAGRDAKKKRVRGLLTFGGGGEVISLVRFLV